MSYRCFAIARGQFTLNTLGIRILTDNETELNTLNIEQFAAKSPIVSRSSYLGMEHFRSLNGLTT